MTYKSIDDILDELQRAGRIVRFVPIFDPDESEKRELFTLPTLYTWLYQTDRRKTMDYKANIRAYLARFVKGRDVDNEDYMKLLSDDIWEIRVQLEKRKGKENTRIFGAFIKPDVLICTHWKLRREVDWDAAIKRVENELDALFPSFSRVVGRPFSNCVTFNASDVL